MRHMKTQEENRTEKPEKVYVQIWREQVAQGVLYVSLCLFLSVVCISTPELPEGTTAGQWLAWRIPACVSAAGIVLALLIQAPHNGILLSDFLYDGMKTAVPWALITMGVIQAVWGLCQLFGLLPSGHSHYALTGSFANPGPYGGYLALVLPLCLNRYLDLFPAYMSAGFMTDAKRRGRKLARAAGLLILMVLPATMSRSAWLAAAVGCGWVGWRWFSWYLVRWWQVVWRRWRGRCIAWCGVAVAVVVVAGVGIFLLKPDSALGRLFIWKMTCRAIASHPFMNFDGFPALYGEAQSSYFASGDYAAWEERVAGTPEYAFNDYLDFTVMLGIPFLVVLLAVLSYLLWRGRYVSLTGHNGALLSLIVFAFSSYPMHLPAFIVAGFLLVMSYFPGRIPMALVILMAMWQCFGMGNDWKRQTDDCRLWAEARMLYRMGADEAAAEKYNAIWRSEGLQDEGAFYFEYGHCLHRLKEHTWSNYMLKEAARLTADPMVLNIMGKNWQAVKEYRKAEECFWQAVHRLPGRIYPYYLLAKLYALPDYRHPDKLEEMKRIVLTKEPKVMSTAIREMREEVEKLD